MFVEAITTTVPARASTPLNAQSGFLPNLSVSQPAGMLEMRMATPTKHDQHGGRPGGGVPFQFREAFLQEVKDEAGQVG